jgi:hypothetical protein
MTSKLVPFCAPLLVQRGVGDGLIVPVYPGGVVPLYPHRKLTNCSARPRSGLGNVRTHNDSLADAELGHDMCV